MLSKSVGKRQGSLFEDVEEEVNSGNRREAKSVYNVCTVERFSVNLEARLGLKMPISFSSCCPLPKKISDENGARKWLVQFRR
jgi:hypothetical protein